MTVTFSAEELLQVYEMLVKHGADTPLLEKLRKPILGILEKEHDRLEKDMYATWTAQELKKIDELSQKNNVLSAPERAAKMTAKKK